MKPRQWTPEDDERLKYFWSVCYLDELACMLECSKNTISEHAKKLNLSKKDKSSAYKQRRHNDMSSCAIACGNKPTKYGYGHKHSKESKLKIAESRKRIYDSERRRIIFGLPQKTKIKVIV